MKPQQALTPRRARWALSAVALLVLTACASSAGIAPSTPEIGAAQLGLPPPGGAPTSAVADQWWTAWGDAELASLMAQALPTPAQPHAQATAKGAPGELPALKEIARLLDLAPETACRALARARKSLAAAGAQTPARPSAWSYFGLPGAAATPAHALAC